MPVELSAEATEFVRLGLMGKPALVALPSLPSFDRGPSPVDITDRDALFAIFDEEWYGTAHKRLNAQRKKD